jgi:hypothetical protein
MSRLSHGVTPFAGRLGGTGANTRRFQLGRKKSLIHLGKRWPSTKSASGGTLSDWSMTRRSGQQFAEKIVRHKQLRAGRMRLEGVPLWSMIRRSGKHFAEKGMCDTTRVEVRLIQSEAIPL